MELQVIKVKDFLINKSEQDKYERMGMSDQFEAIKREVKSYYFIKDLKCVSEHVNNDGEIDPYKTNIYFHPNTLFVVDLTLKEVEHKLNLSVVL